jgi:hypothetical protein
LYSRIFTGDRVQGSDVINVSVRKRDTADWRAHPSGRFAYAGRRTGKAGINEGESIVFPDQEAIDHPETSQTKEIFCFLNKVHAEPREIQ